MVRKILLSVLLAVIAPLAAHAATEVFKLDATSAADFRAQADELRREMAPGGKYEKLTPVEQARVGKQLDRLQVMYDKRADGDSISNSDQIVLVNASEEINAVLSGDEDQKLVCEQVRKLGSNRTEKVCLTVAQRKAAREAAKADMNERRPLGTKGSGL